MDGRRESQPHVHAAGVLFDRPVQKFPNIGEGRNRRERALDGPAAQAHDLAVEKYVLPAGEFRIESRAQLEQRRDAPLRDHASAGGRQNSADNLQECALPASIGTHEAQHLSALEVEADIAQRPEIGMQTIRKKRKDFADAIGGTLVEAVQFGNVLDENQG